MQHVSQLGARDLNPEDQFIRTALGALQRISRSKGIGRTLDLQPWTLTSLEVTISGEHKIGQGSFGALYRGEWDGKVCMLSHDMLSSVSVAQEETSGCCCEANV